MDDLKNTTLKRPMDREAMSNDAMSLRSLVGFLNDPRITGAIAPPDEETAAAVVKEKEKAKAKAAESTVKTKAAPEPLLKPAAVLTPTKSTAPSPTAALLLRKRVMFTGLPKSGKSFLAAQLGARVFEFDDPIFSLAASAFGDVPASSLGQFVVEVRGWGEGIVNERLPLTAARAHFIEFMRSAGKQGDLLFGVPVVDFGTAGFWVNCLLARVRGFERDFPNEVVAVTDLGSAEQYTALKESGFAPFHVTCHPLTRSARGGSDVVDKLSGGVERDITMKVSQSKAGGKLWCVWCDEKYPSASQRFYSVSDFLRAFTH
jgi:hypothetical protein